MGKMQVRTEKIRGPYDMWVIRRTYVLNGRQIGTITKNPISNKYEVVASDFENSTYVNGGEFDKLNDAKQFIIDYQMIVIKRAIKSERDKIMRM